MGTKNPTPSHAPNQHSPKLQSRKIYDPLGPASSSSAGFGCSVLCLFTRNKSPNVLLRLRALVMRDQSDVSLSNDLLIFCAESPFFGDEVRNSSSRPPLPDINPRPPDFVLTKPRRGRFEWFRESTPRRSESAITTLKPPESGDNKAPGIIRDIECLAGVIGLSDCVGIVIF